MRTKRLTLPALVLVLTMTLGGLSVPQAAYATGEETTPITRRATVELVRAGVDHAMAKELGLEIRTDAKGMEYAVKPGTAAGLDNAGNPIGPDNEVDGPCGSSWVDWVEIDFFRHSAKIYTGFAIRTDWSKAVMVPTWRTVVTDSFGVSTREHGPDLDVIKPAHQWVGKRLGFTASGATGAWVDLTVGWAVLADTTICFSLNPFDFTNL